MSVPQPEPSDSTEPVRDTDPDGAAVAAQTPQGISHAVPLVVAVTGHRDLRQAELSAIRARVRDFLTMLRREYPERRLRVMSPLAEGADRLVAGVAVELGAELIVALPMEKRLYCEDFASESSRREFETLLSRASEVYEMPVAAGGAPVVATGAARERQYAQLGVFLCAHCHILLALWDGKFGDQLGGTGQVVKFRHDDIMPGYTTKTVATQQMLVDDESDLVYHIVCSRDRPDGDPQAGLEPLEAFWFTKDRDTPRSKALLSQHRLIFERSSEFSREAIRFAEQVEAEKFPLFRAEDEAHLPEGVGEINRLFCIADWLAIRFQKKTLWTLRVTHLLAFLMGLAFLLFSDLEANPLYMYAFLGLFLVAAAAQYFAKRAGWQRKYLDYRTLAEGLRVQFYWAAAGVTSGNESKYTHDNFLQTQDPELGWIRNVMRVAGVRCDVRADLDPAGLEFVLKEWIGDEESGQIGYFGRKAAARILRHRNTERLGTVSLLTSVAVVILFVLAGHSMPSGWNSPLQVVMGMMLLIYGIRQGFAYATAEKDLIKQYEFMLRIFHNAKRRLDNTDDPVEQRQILLALGGSALDEHAEWLLMHRERSIDQSEFWRVGS